VVEDGKKDTDSVVAAALEWIRSHQE
jgi:hypothetical protein